MRITLDHSLSLEGDVDVDVREGTAVRLIVGEYAAGPVWCGSQLLTGAHRAGTWPLLAGARLTALPARGKLTPPGLHLAAIAGPDAGVVIEIDGRTAVGAGPVPQPLRDDAIDQTHAVLTPQADGGLRVDDAGSVNGTVVWRRRSGGEVRTGRRRSLEARIGDVIVIGRTVFEIRGFAPDEPDRPLAPPGQRARLNAWFARGMSLLCAWRHHLAVEPHLDPTSAAGWASTVQINSATSVETAASVSSAASIACARAVILARGRRPPEPLPLDEDWLRWLPAPLADDGWISIGTSGGPTVEPASVVLTTSVDHTLVHTHGATKRARPVGVHADTADAIARRIASAALPALPRAIGWADVAAYATPPVADEALSDAHSIVAGITLEPPRKQWRVDLSASSPHVLVAGASGTGKSTLLATLASAIAASPPPGVTSMVVVCPGDAGPLAACTASPLFTRVLARARPDEAVRAIDALAMDAGSPPPTHTKPHPAEGALTVLIADDLDAYGPGGGAVTDAIERLACSPHAHVRLLLATARPAAVLSARLRIAMSTVVALRMENEVDSEDIIGVATAAHLSKAAPGEALVRSGAQITRVRAALPTSDHLPAVTRCDDGPTRPLR